MSQAGAAYTRLITGAPLVAVVIGFAAAFALCVGLCWLTARFCWRWGILDRPGPRRIHSAPAPRLGGLAIFGAFVAVSLALYHPANTYERHVYAGLLLASVLVVGVMAYDDVRGLPPLPRLCAQCVAALVAMFPAGHGTLIEVLHNPLTASHHGRTFLGLWLAIPFTLFWMVGMMNTINWVDGVDGLAGGLVTIAALTMAAISWLLGQHTAALLCAILAGAALGFLILNWHPARLFMGDCGAMFLGLALAVLSNMGGAKLAVMLLLLGLPILDATRVVARRVREGRSPLRADRSHLHHRLLAGGFSQRQVALLFYGVTAAFGSVTILVAALQANGDLARLGAALRREPLSAFAPPGIAMTGLLLAAGYGVWRAKATGRAHRMRQAAAEATDSQPVLSSPAHPSVG